LILCIIYGIISVVILKDLNKYNNKDCKKISSQNDFCSKNTLSYLGTYHLGYKFQTNNYRMLFVILYFSLIFIPVLFTKSMILGIIWLCFVTAIYVMFNTLGNGEISAMWCFLSLIFTIPVALLEKQITKILI
jgi:cellulose synthase/poly-beta-1,6-N-acetylglucosamine synthase-like glycosyltransferase